ncbi:MAG: cation:proton antiporter [Patescibacteria group bacterium]
MQDFFLELSLIVVLAAAVSIVMRALKQPLIIGYIITGVIVGPIVLGVIDSTETLDSLASFGIALLLFVIGLGLNPKVIKEVGAVAVFTGVGQVAFTSAAGWGIARLLGYGMTEAVFIAVALAFSSTIIILKLLSDKKEQHRLYGKISIGFLLVQDILATVALIAASASANGSLSASDLGELLVTGALLCLGLFLIIAYILPLFRSLISGSQELLFIFAIAWGFGIASIFKETGFSLEVGALAAGIALATQPFATEVGSRLRPLRDFFIVLFFVSLGTHIKIDGLAEMLPEALLLSGFVLIGNPIIVMTIMGLLRFTRKTSFKAGLAVAQISEFSLVFILLGRNNGQVSEEVVSLVTAVGIITIAVSSYMIIYSDKLFGLLSPYLSIFERSSTRKENESTKSAQLLLIGYKRGGEQFVKVFRELKKKYLVLDYDPAVIDKLDHDHVPNVYGDVTDLELLEEIHIDKARMIVSVMSDYQANKFLAEYLHKSNPKAVLICSAESEAQAAELYASGASYVMMPHYIGNEKIVSFIKKSGLERSAFDSFKARHMRKITNAGEPKKSKTKRRLGKAAIGR